MIQKMKIHLKDQVKGRDRWSLGLSDSEDSTRVFQSFQAD